MAPLAADAQRQLLLQFAASAAHEIAGPIDQITSLVAFFVRRYRGTADEEADALLAMIEKGGARLEATASGLRKCLQVGTALTARTPVAMNAALESALAGLAPQIAECDADIRTEPLPVIEGDRALLVSLFHALLDNALKFRNPDERLAVTVSTLPAPDDQVIQVRDNGPGIDPQYSELVFAPFKKLNGHTYPGAGLGLTMARLVAELHGGRIWIEPSVNGTCVRFLLP
jgi:light-regulated signal transduction histidine kinase (bacteriophytochrome)